MKTILEFNSDEEMEACRAMKAPDLERALHEVKEMLRRKWKYDDLTEVSADTIVDKIYEEFHEITSGLLN